LKVDLQKVFDNMNREFVLFMMECMEFPRRWIDWIRECIGNPTFCIRVSGSPTSFFASNRGIRRPSLPLCLCHGDGVLVHIHRVSMVLRYS